MNKPTKNNQTQNKPTQIFSPEAQSLLMRRQEMKASGHHCQGGGGWH
ncbi:hypothetical protein [Pseudomonas sp. NPDC089734]